MPLNWNKQVIKCACMLYRYNRALNRERLCFYNQYSDLHDKMGTNVSHTSNRAQGVCGRICQLHIISDYNSSTVTSYLLLLQCTAC